MAAGRNGDASGGRGAVKGRALIPANGRGVAPVMQADGVTIGSDAPATTMSLLAVEPVAARPAQGVGTSG